VWLVEFAGRVTCPSQFWSWYFLHLRVLEVVLWSGVQDTEMEVVVVSMTIRGSQSGGVPVVCQARMGPAVLPCWLKAMPLISYWVSSWSPVMVQELALSGRSGEESCQACSPCLRCWIRYPSALAAGAHPTVMVVVVLARGFRTGPSGAGRSG
jgi:hypothetical protein